MMTPGKMTMNSIDKRIKQDQQRAEKFFCEKILPIAESINDPERWFPSGQDDSLETYWQQPIPQSAFEVVEVDLDHLEETLSKLWQDEPDLRKLAPSLSALARKLRREEAVDEISPFIYAMF